MPDVSVLAALAAAALLAPLVGGRWNAPVAAWMLPVFLLHTVGAVPPWAAYLVAMAVLTFGGAVALAGQIPLPGPVYLAVVGATSALLALPFLAHRFTATAVDGFALTLVFPAAVVAVEAAMARFGPYGSWGSIAYTQYGNLPLLQVLALGGNGAVTFLVSWFGSTAAWAWSHGFDPQRVGAGVAGYLVVLAAVLLCGGVRLIRSRRGGPTVAVATVVEPDAGRRVVPSADAPAAPDTSRTPGGSAPLSTTEVFALLFEDGDLDDDQWAALRTTSAALVDSLLARSREQARAGAQIVVWAEGAGLVTAGDELAFLTRAAELARDEEIYLAAALAVAHRAGPRHLDNCVTLFTPAGEPAFVVSKNRPVPGAEAAHTLESATGLRWVDTPHGRLGALICFDADIPRVARQISAARLDILLLPASDWPAIDPTHSEMAALRGIEHGVSVVRPTRWGLSLVTDPYGRVLASAHHVAEPPPALVAHVPVRGASTRRHPRRSDRQDPGPIHRPVPAPSAGVS